MTEVKIAAVLFAIVFVLNVLPAFAPPTWTTISFIGLVIPNNNSIAEASQLQLLRPGPD